MSKQAKQFAIAKSSNGTIGLITSKEMVDHTYPDQTEPTQVWKGVIIQPNTFTGRNGSIIEAKAGGLWTSSNPEVIGYADPEMIAQLVQDSNEVQQFSIAKSSNGTVGLITSKEMVDHIYPDKEEATKVWKGVIIQPNTFTVGEDKVIEAKAGGLWTSSNPQVVGHIDPAMIEAA
ncbi:MAG: hypothetical protein CL760_09310 [Chloroflexi bacterium]|nr:hypothetical protein [Chloroflexota bacterium]|tara:strand:- start:10032 stop:10556 length:525 start_codon:yes stop_codon:yes gene_type:complete